MAAVCHTKWISGEYHAYMRLYLGVEPAKSFDSNRSSLTIWTRTLRGKESPLELASGMFHCNDVDDFISYQAASPCSGAGAQRNLKTLLHVCAQRNDARNFPKISTFTISVFFYRSPRHVYVHSKHENHKYSRLAPSSLPCPCPRSHLPPHQVG